MEPLDILLDAYQEATEGWLAQALAAGQLLFRRLAALELVVFGLAVAFKSRSAESLFPELTWKLFLIAFLFTALLLYPLWVPAITPSFAALAGEITGFTTLNPVVVVKQGIAVALALLFTSISSGWIFPDPFGAALGILVSLAIVAAFIAIAAIMTKTLIESWIVLAAGPFFFGFAPFRLTAQIADNFVVYAVQVGIKLFFLILLLSAAQGVAIRWVQIMVLASVYNLQLVLEILAGAILLAVALWAVPSKLADVLTRSWQLGIRQGLGE
jgi:type IV secretion system protein TrbL